MSKRRDDKTNLQPVENLKFEQAIMLHHALSVWNLYLHLVSVELIKMIK